jgi:hypothetical protein
VGGLKRWNFEVSGSGKVLKGLKGGEMFESFDVKGAREDFEALKAKIIWMVRKLGGSF